MYIKYYHNKKEAINWKKLSIYVRHKFVCTSDCFIFDEQPPNPRINIHGKYFVQFINYMDLIIKDMLPDYCIQILNAEQYVFLYIIKLNAGLFIAIVKIDKL